MVLCSISMRTRKKDGRCCMTSIVDEAELLHLVQAVNSRVTAYYLPKDKSGLQLKHFTIFRRSCDISRVSKLLSRRRRFKELGEMQIHDVEMRSAYFRGWKSGEKRQESPRGLHTNQEWFDSGNVASSSIF